MVNIKSLTHKCCYFTKKRPTWARIQHGEYREHAGEAAYDHARAVHLLAAHAAQDDDDDDVAEELHHVGYFEVEVNVAAEVADVQG